MWINVVIVCCEYTRVSRGTFRCLSLSGNDSVMHSPPPGIELCCINRKMPLVQPDSVVFFTYSMLHYCFYLNKHLNKDMFIILKISCSLFYITAKPAKRDFLEKQERQIFFFSSQILGKLLLTRTTPSVESTPNSVNRAVSELKCIIFPSIAGRVLGLSSYNS